MKLGSLEMRFLRGIVILSGLCLALYFIRVGLTHSWHDYFMVENLFLAWLPLIFSWWLIRRLINHRWRSPLNIILSVAWLIFLPNTWYVLTDYVHLTPT